MKATKTQRIDIRHFDLDVFDRMTIDQMIAKLQEVKAELDDEYIEVRYNYEEDRYYDDCTVISQFICLRNENLQERKERLLQAKMDRETKKARQSEKEKREREQYEKLKEKYG